MKNKSYCNPARRQPAIKALLLMLAGGVCILLCEPPALAASDAPQWMHALVSVPLPAYDEKTSAVLLYSETNVVVVSTDKIRTQVREAYRILRPEGRHHGTVVVYASSNKKVTSLHGWCIPAQGKDFEVKDKDAVEMAPMGMENGELVTDLKAKVLHIPAPDPGNIVGYEYEVEEQPFVLQDGWRFQETNPVRESHYTLQLPPGWEYKASFLNFPQAQPSQVGANQWQWSVHDVKEIRIEAEMPPVSGIAGQMIVSFFPAGGPSTKDGFANWQGMGSWYGNLVTGRTDASPEIKQEVVTLTASKPSILEKMQALGEFVQHDIRYVAIELGIGGWQPHYAADIFSHRYGDCKDKATLMRSMLHEIGVDSYYVVINTQRGSITPTTPAHQAFNHAILAVKLPDGLADPSLVATWQHPTLGKVLFFDPTDELTPFGRIRGPLQANYGLLVTPNGGELVQLPQQAAAMNSIQRTAKFTLDPDGTLTGDVKEVRLGDRAMVERWRLRTVTQDKDRIKPIETVLAGSLSSFQIRQASIVNLQLANQPFGFNYSFVSDNYAKNAGDLLLVRPRVLGDKSSALLETKEPRRFSIELEEPTRDTDTFEITIPPGYTVDDLPPAVDADYSFASYHSKTETTGNEIRYTRTFEVKELSVPVERSDDLRKFYRTIASDERNTVVLKVAPK
jgi:Domain of Unknown Function with PDB structure (DUF3857)/Transglutaminase-like superfamily